MNAELDAYKGDTPEVEMSTPVETQGQNAIAATRAMQEVQGQIIMAKKFPRDIYESVKRIMKACERYKLAEESMYTYPRGGTVVTGPSIRLAECIARNWGNLDFGIRELEQKNGESTVEAYSWDLETNVKVTKVFTVKHERKARGKITKLIDPRDIYEMVANQGARRLRACILGIIPSDVVQDSVKMCEGTLAKGPNNEPFEDRLKKMVNAFDKVGIKVKDIEERLGHNIDATVPNELVTLQKIYMSLKDGMSKRGDWFESYKNETSEKSKDLSDKLKGLGGDEETKQGETSENIGEPESGTKAKNSTKK
jgi:hypothetical protein